MSMDIHKYPWASKHNTDIPGHKGRVVKSHLCNMRGNAHCLLGLDPKWESVVQSLNTFEQLLQKMQYLDQG